MSEEVMRQIAEMSGLPSRFWSKVTIAGDCWVFKTRRGHPYGEFQIYGKRWKAHRLLKFKIDPPKNDNLHACHTCDNPPCINPFHIFWGTHLENKIDSVKKNRAYFPFRQKIICKYGHSVTGDNAWVGVSKEGYKIKRCRTCDRRDKARRYIKSKAIIEEQEKGEQG